MSAQSEYTRLVNKYLDGGMIGSEKEIFEEQLHLDPMLKSEFDHQNEIVAGLREYRKSELKARLDNISVTPGVLGLLTQSGSVKTLSYIAASVMVGAGAYLYFTPESNELVELSYLNSKREFIISEPKNIDLGNSLDYRYMKSTKPGSWIETSEHNSDKEEANDISFEVPKVTEEQSADLIDQPEEVIEKSLSHKSNFVDVSKLDKVDIKNVVTNRYRFHYRLIDNKLFLYGKFDASPYEIIEVNSFQNKRLFFYYNGKYYRLLQDFQDIAPLVEISDQALINELNIIKRKG